MSDSVERDQHTVSCSCYFAACCVHSVEHWKTSLIYLALISLNFM